MSGEVEGERMQAEQIERAREEALAGASEPEPQPEAQPEDEPE